MAERRPSRLWGCLARLGALSGTAAVIGLAGLAVAGVGGWWAYRHYVVDEPGPEFDRAHVRSIIAQESPVFFRDGTTRVGVFFESEHRQFVPFDELPTAYVMAIVAAEDGTYWTHPGVSAKHVVRAFRDNLLAGDLVAGGSTLTQQTAKNLFYRPDRSLRAKLGELLNALKLEAHFDKTEILEFYANQFHVTGNGRGLGIAARHFFDKDPQDLTTLEAAFLAGLVKGPANYDPFFGDDAHRERAIERAHARTRYVLSRMVDEPVEHLAGPPSDGTAAGDRLRAERVARATAVRDEAVALLKDGFELPFRHGNFRYDSSAVLDEVARRLAEPPFDDILGQAGIDDPKNAGLVVITTLDVAAQREATWSLWHHLTEVGTWLEAKGPADFVVPGARPPRFDPDLLPGPHEFRLARVVEKPGAAGKKTVTLDLGGAPCTVDRAGVVRVAVATERGRRKDSGAKASSEVVDAWVDALPTDGVVLASVREVSPEGRICDLELRPELQGSVVVLEEGQVRAMVGGNDNRNFNRATALRQFGSTWKPLVYHAALSLGWSPDDVIDNGRNVFPFSSTWYYPSPDHDPQPQVSMSWAGVNSENLAAVWLLYHLTDRLDGDEVRQLAGQLDLAPRPGESTEAYQTRIQRLGVLPTRARVEEGLFLQSRREVLAGIESGRHPEDEVALQSLLFGWGFATERNRAGSSRAAALANDFQSLRERRDSCRFQAEALERAIEAGQAPDPSVVTDLTVQREGDRVHVACGEVPEGYVTPDAAFVAGTWSAPPEEPAPPEPGRFRLFPRPRARPAPVEGPQLDALDDLLIDDRLHWSTLDELDAAFERRKLTIDETVDLYDPEILYWHQDFRVLLSMRYVASLAQDFGVQTEIREVLAMPLGASEITLEEATSLYAGVATGLGWEFPGRSQGRVVGAVPSATVLIAEIRDVDGRVLYRADGRPTQVTDPEIGGMTTDILRNVVQHGTGRRAADAVRLGSTVVPVAGKTGTTNDFRNAAFVGVVPRATPEGWDVRSGFFVGAYVGYDDNRPMSVGRIRLAGASGALPAWIGTAQGLANAGLLGRAAPAEPTLLGPASLVRVPVDTTRGLPDPEGAGSILVRGDGMMAWPDLSMPRIVRPARRRGAAVPPDASPGTRTAPPERGEAVTPEPEPGRGADEEEVLVDP